MSKGAGILVCTDAASMSLALDVCQEKGFPRMAQWEGGKPTVKVHGLSEDKLNDLVKEIRAATPKELAR